MQPKFVYCNHCGIANTEGTSYCVRCGKAISGVKAPNTPQPSQNRLQPTPQQPYRQPTPQQPTPQYQQPYRQLNPQQSNPQQSNPQQTYPQQSYPQQSYQQPPYQQQHVDQKNSISIPPVQNVSGKRKSKRRIVKEMANERKKQEKERIRQFKLWRKEQKKLERKRRWKSRLVSRLVLLVFLVCIGFSVYGSLKLMKSLPIPFEFGNDQDSMLYITESFTANSQYFNSGQYGDFIWKSTSEEIAFTLTEQEDGNFYVANVQRPSGKQKKVTLFGIARYFCGVAVCKYDVILIPQQTIQASEIAAPESTVTTSDQLQVYYAADGNVEDIYGDLGKIYIYSAEDAIQTALAYKSTFRQANEITFQLYNQSITEEYKNFYLQAYWNGIPLAGEIETVSTDANNKLQNVQNDVRTSYVESMEDHIADQTISVSDAIARAVSQTSGCSVKSFAPMDEELVIYEHVLCHAYYVTDSEDNLYECLIHAGNGNAIYCAQVKMSALSETTYEQLYGSMVDIEPSGMVSVLANVYPATVRGVDERGKRIEADASYDPVTKTYYLIDAERNFKIYEMDDEDTVLGMLTTLVLDDVSIPQSDTETFDTAVSLETLANLQHAYDWYQSEMHRTGWDGRGGEMICRTNSYYFTDNAFWNPLFNNMSITIPNIFTTSYASIPLIIYHEYTHAVYDSMHLGFGFSKDNSALEEAYADIMGYFICDARGELTSCNKEDCTLETEWAAGPIEKTSGRMYYFRNSTHLECNGSPLPDTYEACAAGIGKDDAYPRSVYYSNVAYQMYQSNVLSKEMTEQIWYRAMGYFTNPVCDAYKCSKNVLKAANALGCSKAQQDYIATLFAEHGILTSDYTITTSEEDLNDIVNGLKDAVSDRINDVTALLDPDAHAETDTYVVTYSPIMSLFGGNKITVMISSNYSDEFLDRLEADLIARCGESCEVSFQYIPSVMLNKVTEGYIMHITENPMDQGVWNAVKSLFVYTAYANGRSELVNHIDSFW